MISASAVGPIECPEPEARSALPRLAGFYRQRSLVPRLGYQASHDAYFNVAAYFPKATVTLSMISLARLRLA